MSETTPHDPSPPDEVHINVPPPLPNHSPDNSHVPVYSATASVPSRNRPRSRPLLVPYPDFIPFRTWSPRLVPCFVTINVVLFVVMMYINDCPDNVQTGSKCILGFLGRFSFQSLSDNPLLGPSSYTLLKMGALYTENIVKGRQAWRLFTCIWLHAGVFHILPNMLSLLFIGIRLEQEFGFVRIGSVYIISGFGGSLLSALFLQTKISVGASGALFGLLGSMLSEILINWTIYANKLAALLTLIFIIVVNLAVGILPHMDNFAHIGGFLSGFLLGFVFLIRPQFAWMNQKNPPPGFIAATTKPKHKTYQYVLWAVSVALLIVGCEPVLHLVSLSKLYTYLKMELPKIEFPVSYGTKGNLLTVTCPTNGKSVMYLISDNNVSLKKICTLSTRCSPALRLDTIIIVKQLPH